MDLLSLVGAIPDGRSKWTTYTELEVIVDVLLAMAQESGVAAELAERVGRAPPPLTALAQAMQNGGSR